MIGKLLEHRQAQTTARYAHLARESVKTSAASLASKLYTYHPHTGYKSGTCFSICSRIFSSKRPMSRRMLAK